MKEVNFFCIGAQKAGTTLLHDILIQHQDIYLPPKKEAHFFDVNERYSKGLSYYYETFFNTYSGEKLIGNINPNLQIENRSLDRIIDCFGTDVKIIFLLRNPVKRAYSHYLMSRKRGLENLSFLEALKDETKRIENPKKHKDYETQELGHFEKNHLGYIKRSLYAEKIEYLYNNFSKENIKIVLFENLVSKKEETISDILDFLKVQKGITFDLEIKSNPAQKARLAFLSKFLNKPSVFKDFFKTLIPLFLRERLRAFLNRLNLKTLNSDEKRISFEEYNIASDYFKKDLIKLEKFIEIKDLWKY